jgi:hypothetical protein
MSEPYSSLMPHIHVEMSPSMQPNGTDVAHVSEQHLTTTSNVLEPPFTTGINMNYNSSAAITTVTDDFQQTTEKNIDERPEIAADEATKISPKILGSSEKPLTQKLNMLRSSLQRTVRLEVSLKSGYEISVKEAMEKQEGKATLMKPSPTSTTMLGDEEDFLDRLARKYSVSLIC